MGFSQVNHFQCPQCGADCEATVWGGINTKEDATAKKRVLDGSFFGFRCPQCGHEASLVYNTLYLDEISKLMIYLIQGNEDNGGNENAETEARYAAAAVPFWKEGGYTLRIVHSIHDLREKVKLFDSGYDDRIVELVKGIVLSQCPEEIYVTEIHFDVLAGQKFLVLLDNEGGEQYVPNFEELYDELYSRFMGRLPAIQGRDFECVDLEYASKLMQKLIEAEQKEKEEPVKAPEADGSEPTAAPEEALQPEEAAVSVPAEPQRPQPRQLTREEMERIVRGG